MCASKNFDSVARSGKCVELSMRTCTIKINRKSRVDLLYPGPGFLYSDAWPSAHMPSFDLGR